MENFILIFIKMENFFLGSVLFNTNKWSTVLIFWLLCGYGAKFNAGVTSS